MVLPLVAGIIIAAAAGAAGGGAAGSIFGGNIDDEKKRYEDAVNEYLKQANTLQRQYDDNLSISTVINRNRLIGQKGFGIDNTYLTDLTKAFQAPKKFDTSAQ